ncbi:hypothetical protein DFP72DRAFT_827356 [Ephemerocybe angulata]|uniref:DUF4470 domain-containing protein n=1 Tax=Ephemerocybe angulata TaxID=980116 RepID=A0A8H6HB00_9AGAR|nr:hypothetical protein DFP72DRAFT_827356 [Tulosesus angulatus]
MSTQAERALNAKNKGNVHFKAGRLEEAAKHYQEAVGFDPASVIYPSNLSAAFYELGQYDSCCRSILNAWTLVDGAADAAIAKKLSLRLAKALVLGLQDGTISQQLVRDNQSIIEAVRAIAQDDPSWGVYRELEEKIQSGTYEIAKKDAKKRFAHLPLFHGTPDPQMTFFTFGTDDLMSLADGWGSDEPDPLPLKDFTSEQLGNLSFLIAGCGDGEPKAMQSQSLGLLHDFGLTQEQKDSVKIHLTLLDIHPATIARDVIFFMFLDQLVNMEDMKLEKLEIVTTLFYLYCGYMLPTYCYDRWVAAVKQLHAIISRPVTSVGGPSLPSYIFLPPSSFPAIIPYLNHWLQPPVGTIKFTRLMKHVGGFERTRQLQELHASGALGPKYSGMPDPIVMQQREAEEKVDALLSGRTSINRAILKMPFTKLRQKVKDSREDLIDLLVCMKMDRSVMYGVHGSIKKAASSKAGKKQGSKSSSSSSSNSGSWYHAKNDWDKGRLVQSAKAIRASWKANMSLDDGKHGTRDQELDLDLFQTIHYFAEFDEIYGLGNGENGEGKRESPAWAYGAAFFMGVVEAIKELTLGEDEGEGGVSGGGDRLKIEFVADGLHEYLAKMRAHAEDTRPETFPTKWTRIWLGSVPDYTNGTLNTVTYVVPALQDDVPTSSVASNCLFNSPVWADDNEFCYNYTMLLPSDLKRYLALHTINPNAVQDILDVNSYQPLPRPLSTLATKPELFSWLTKLFLSHIHPGYTQPRPRLVKMPNGLPAFFGLLVRLREIGYPGHWLSEWVQNVLDGEASADSLIYKDTLPRPLREKGGGRAPLHKVRLDPWLLELEWILATGKDSLPFSVRLPPSIFDGKEATRYRDIGTFEAKGLEPTIEYGMFYNHDAVAALLFYKSTKDIGGSKYFKDMLLKVGKIVDNVETSDKDTVPKGAFFILTAPEHVNLARWRMGKASAKRMIREKWNMVVFRMDLWMPLTHPCPASKWIFQND